MGIFKSIFGESGEQPSGKASIWNDLLNVSQLDDIIADSDIQAVAIFKHSTRCSISRMALKQFERNFKPGKVKLYFLDLLQHRDISDRIAERFAVRHQSPQLIVIKNGEPVFNASHDGIDAQELERF